MATRWCEGVDGDGIGEWIDLVLGEQIAGESLALEIVPGYAKSGALFLKNGRPKKLAVEMDGVVQESPLTLEDRAVVQVFNLNGLGRPVGKIRLKIIEVYRGTQFSDTCISEIVVKRLLPKGEWDGTIADSESNMLVSAFYGKNLALRKDGFEANSLELAMRLVDGMYARGAEGSEMLKELVDSNSKCTTA